MSDHGNKRARSASSSSSDADATEAADKASVAKGHSQRSASHQSNAEPAAAVAAGDASASGSTSGGNQSHMSSPPPRPPSPQSSSSESGDPVQSSPTIKLPSPPPDATPILPIPSNNQVSVPRPRRKKPRMDQVPPEDTPPPTLIPEAAVEKPIPMEMPTMVPTTTQPAETGTEIAEVTASHTLPPTLPQQSDCVDPPTTALQNLCAVGEMMEFVSGGDDVGKPAMGTQTIAKPKRRKTKKVKDNASTLLSGKHTVPTVVVATPATMMVPVPSTTPPLPTYAEPYDPHDPFTWNSMETAVRTSHDIFQDKASMQSWVDGMLLRCVRYLDGSNLYVVKMGDGVHKLHSTRDLEKLGGQLRLQFVDVATSLAKKEGAKAVADIRFFYILDHIKTEAAGLLRMNKLQFVPYVDTRGLSQAAKTNMRQSIQPGVVNTFPGFHAQLLHEVGEGGTVPYAPGNFQQELAAVVLCYVEALCAVADQHEDGTPLVDDGGYACKFHQFVKRMIFGGGEGDATMLVLCGSTKWTGVILQFLARYLLGDRCTISAQNSADLCKGKIKHLPETAILLTIARVTEDDVSDWSLEEPTRVVWGTVRTPPPEAERHTLAMAKRRAQGSIAACHVQYIMAGGAAIAFTPPKSSRQLFIPCRTPDMVEVTRKAELHVPSGAITHAMDLLVLESMCRQDMADAYLTYLWNTDFTTVDSTARGSPPSPHV